MAKPQRPVRIAVVGAGWWGTTAHATALSGHPHAELTGFVDPDPGRLAGAAARFPVPYRFPSLTELVNARVADGVIIATPASTHYRLAHTALTAGLHVLLEKPFTLYAREAWELVELAARTDLTLTASHPYQHTRAAQTLRTLLADGALGELIQVGGLFASAAGDLYRGDPAAFAAGLPASPVAPLAATYADPALAGGGHGQTQLSHVAAALTHATGQRGDRVTAYLHHGGLPIDIAGAVALTLTGGTVVALASAGDQRPGDHSPQLLHYLGSRGYACHDLRAGTLDWRQGKGSSERLEPTSGEPAYPQLAPAREFVGLIRTGGTSRAPAEGAARAVELIEAIYRSAATAREVRVADLPAGPPHHPSPPRQETAT